jgi:23S rRNA pseudouridine2605 synthase
MAKQFGGGRSNNRTSFGKRQEADDAFRKKKKETGGTRSGRGEFKPGGDDKRSGGSRPRTFGGPKREGSGSGPRSFGGPRREGSGGPRREGSGGPRREGSERRGFSGTRYEGGARKFSGSRSTDRRDDRGEGRGDRGERSGERRTDRDDKKPFERRSSRPGSFTKRPYEKREGRSFDKKEGRSFDKPRRSSSDRPERPERRSFVEGKVDRERERPQREEAGVQPVKTGDELIRLNKFISNSGVCSRREADELIKMGVITVNGTAITEMGYKVKPTDEIRHDGKKLTAEKPVYILLNKPKGFITTTDDPQERNTVMELIAGACKERVYPVGRLDRNTTGLLLLTNDGDLTDKLTHPSFNAKKIYKVELDKPLAKVDFDKIVEGVRLEEGKAIVDDLAIVSDDKLTVGIELHIGWNHVVRRIFNALEYDVVKLDRVVYAGLDKKDLKRGQWRFLKSDEIVRLKHFG